MPGQMREYRCRWQQQPTNYHTEQVLFVRASSPDDARRVVRELVERSRGITRFSIYEPTEVSSVCFPRREIMEGAICFDADKDALLAVLLDKLSDGQVAEVFCSLGLDKTLT